MGDELQGGLALLQVAAIEISGFLSEKENLCELQDYGSTIMNLQLIREFLDEHGVSIPEIVNMELSRYRKSFS